MASRSIFPGPWGGELGQSLPRGRFQEITSGRNCLEGKDDDAPENQDSDNGLEAGSEHETEEGADGGFQRLGGILFRVEKFGEEGSEEGTENHADRGQDDSGDESYHGSAFRIFASAGSLCQEHRNDIVKDRDQGYDDSPDNQAGQCHGLSRGIGTAAPDIEQEQSNPADRGSGKSGKDAAGDSDEAGGEG